MARKLDFPVFDADNHLYETQDAFTRYLPSEHAGLIKYVEVKGRVKIAVKNRISEYIPNPTFNTRDQSKSWASSRGVVGSARDRRPQAAASHPHSAAPS